jgi:serine/threonine protein kinase
MNTKASQQDAYDQTVLLAPPPRLERNHLRGVDDPLIGTLLAEAYRIECVLGEGGMGRLYEAEHVRMGRRVAVKVIHQQIAQREDMRLRFEREARVMARVRSDHVVGVLDIVSAPDGRTCIVTELLQGMNLEEYLEDNGDKLPVGEVVALARQCLRGLAAAHALGVVHRDLKPANLFLATDSTGEAALKVLDFGVAKLGGDAEMTTTGTIVGTPAYMAPEQARGARLADARSDLYAVGAVLYRALTGQSPYGGSDSHGTLIRLMEESPARPTLIEKTIPPGLEAVIEKAMARDPDERFQSADEFIRALEPFQAATHLRPGLHKHGEPLDDPKTLGRRARLVRPAAVPPRSCSSPSRRPSPPPPRPWGSRVCCRAPGATRPWCRPSARGSCRRSRWAAGRWACSTCARPCGRPWCCCIPRPMGPAGPPRACSSPWPRAAP